METMSLFTRTHARAHTHTPAHTRVRTHKQTHTKSIVLKLQYLTLADNLPSWIKISLRQSFTFITHCSVILMVSLIPITDTNFAKRSQGPFVIYSFMSNGTLHFMKNKCHPTMTEAANLLQRNSVFHF